MDFQGVVSRHGLGDRRSLLINLAAVPLGYVLANALLYFITPEQSTDFIYQSPRRLLQNQNTDALPYPTNALPGARDVDTPYGSIRVYEWGPETGRKVLFVHGISTPCIAFAGLAKKLVEEQGCRVLLFDLFGRGYSDAPDPEFYPQNLRLWTAQIFCVLSSSPLSWMGGDETFALIGYSLGGGIAASFTSYFPALVSSLILIAPAGLMRDSRIHWTSKFIYGGLLPQFVANWIVTRRLTSSSPPPSQGKAAVPESGEQAATISPGAIAESEVPHPALMANSGASIFPDRPGISAAHAVDWQVAAHPGFLASFISSIKCSPTRNQHERWRLIAVQREHLRERKVLLLVGKTDSVILPDETADDAVKVLGKENVWVEVLEGGHDVPIVNAGGCARVIGEFWA